MAEKTISLPFSIDAYGKVSATTDQTKIWADRVRSAVGTTIRERVIRSNFGSVIAQKVFDTQDMAENAIKANVAEVFRVHLPLLTLQKVELTFDEYSSTTNVLITYGLPNDTVISTTVGVVTILGNNPPAEENL